MRGECVVNNGTIVVVSFTCATMLKGGVWVPG
jgi:hypothetical protein